MDVAVRSGLLATAVDARRGRGSSTCLVRLYASKQYASNHTWTGTTRGFSNSGEVRYSGKGDQTCWKRKRSRQRLPTNAKNTFPDRKKGDIFLGSSLAKSVSLVLVYCFRFLRFTRPSGLCSAFLNSSKIIIDRIKPANNITQDSWSYPCCITTPALTLPDGSIRLAWDKQVDSDL